jgi:signal peptidase
MILKIVKKILSMLPILIFMLALFIIITVSISYRKGKVPKVFGYSYMIVLTGSMAPDINIDDFIMVKESSIYNVNDRVSFYYDIDNNGTLEIVTHRIKAIKDGIYTVQGDAARENDKQEITKNKIIGKVVFKSTFLGQIFSLNFIRNKNYIFGIIILSLFIFGGYQIVHIVKLSKEKK